jgi:hypothetical protein
VNLKMDHHVSFKVSLHEGPGQETWDSKYPLMDSTSNLNWTQAWRLVSQTRRGISMSGALQDVAGKWCHISANSWFHTLDPNPHVTSLGPKFCTRPVGSLELESFV